MYIINICKNFKYLNKYIKVDVNISSNSPPQPNPWVATQYAVIPL